MHKVTGHVQTVELALPAAFTFADHAELMDRVKVALRQLQAAAGRDEDLGLAYEAVPWSRQVPGLAIFAAADHLHSDGTAEEGEASAAATGTGQADFMEMFAAFAPRFTVPAMDQAPFANATTGHRIGYLVDNPAPGDELAGAMEVRVWDPATNAYIQSGANGIAKEAPSPNPSASRGCRDRVEARPRQLWPPG